MLHYGINQVTMRIDQTESLACVHVRFDHIGEKGRFSCTCLSHDIHMPKFVLILDTEDDFFALVVCLS